MNYCDDDWDLYPRNCSDTRISILRNSQFQYIKFFILISGAHAPFNNVQKFNGNSSTVLHK